MPGVNESLVRRIFHGVFNSGNLSLIDQVYSSGHMLYLTDVDGRKHTFEGIDSVKHSASRSRELFPDLHIVIDKITSEDDRVVIHHTFRGTLKGERRTAIRKASATVTIAERKIVNT